MYMYVGAKALRILFIFLKMLQINNATENGIKFQSSSLILTLPLQQVNENYPLSLIHI